MVPRTVEETPHPRRVDAATDERVPAPHETRDIVTHHPTKRPRYRDPERIACKIALTEALKDLAETHPLEAHSLFDVHFLEDSAAPLLAQLLLLHRDPPPASDLAHAWRVQFGQSTASDGGLAASIEPAGGFGPRDSRFRPRSPGTTGATTDARVTLALVDPALASNAAEVITIETSPSVPTSAGPATVSSTTMIPRNGGGCSTWRTKQ